MINTTYRDITLEQAEEYHSRGLIVICNGDGLVIDIKEDKEERGA